MKGRGDERAVAPQSGELLEVLRIPDAAAGDERHTRGGVPHVRDQPFIESSAASDARQVDHDHRACTRGHCAGGNDMPRLVASDLTAHRRQGFAVSEIKAERHAIAAESGADLVQLGIRLERFEANDHAGDVQRTQVARTRCRRHTGIEPQRNMERREPSDKAILRAAAENRIQVSGVQLIDAKVIHIRARDLQGIAGCDRDARNRLNRLIVLALAEPRVDGAPVEQIKHANDLHGGSGGPARRAVVRARAVL